MVRVDGAMMHMRMINMREPAGHLNQWGLKEMLLAGSGKTEKMK